MDFLRSPGPKCLHRCGHYAVAEIVLDQSLKRSNPDGSRTFGVTGCQSHSISVASAAYEWRKLVSRIDKPFDKPILQTVRGAGYKLDPAT